LLITIAQSLTVLGIPAQAATLLYLGTRPELIGERKVPRWILVLAAIGFCVSCVFAVITASKVYTRLTESPETAWHQLETHERDAVDAFVHNFALSDSPPGGSPCDERLTCSSC
jgi:hypothetical protein